jgi:FkbM family methyltransferase
LISYAQNFEDVMLARLFAGQESGFYVDIGAGHPSRLSVTKHFYDHGWHGINVEPIANNWELFLKERPRDTNLNVAIARRPGRRAFCEVLDDSGLSTLDVERTTEIESTGRSTVRYEVDCVTGDSILEAHAGEIDFLKIDVEGAEAEVLMSIDLGRHRPRVLVVEAVAPMATFPGWERFAPDEHERCGAWEPRVLESGYVLAHFDGLNRFYLREDLRHLAHRLSIPPGVFDFIVRDMQEEFRRRQHADSADMTSLLEKEAAIQALNRAARDAEQRMQEATRALEEANRGLEERDAVIESLRGQVQSVADDLERGRRYQQLLAKALDDKEAVIRELSGAVDAFRQAFWIFGFVVRPLNFALGPLRLAIGRARHAFVPRLGNLNQHAPRPLQLPEPHARRCAAPACPRISIVTPSFNQAAFIERTILSVLNQGYPNLEYVVQDGASRDGTVEILKRHASQLAAWDSSPDSGQTQAINRGFAKTGGDIMAWLNSDDILFPGALDYIADFFMDNPQVDVVYGHRILIDTRDRQIGRWILPAHDDEVLSWADFVPQETLFWRRSIWERAGGQVDESFRFAMDWDLLVRFRDAEARFAVLPRFVGGFRIHPHQKTSADITDVGYREMDRIRERALGRVPTPIEVRKAVLPYLFKHVVADYRWRISKLIGGSK